MSWYGTEFITCRWCVNYLHTFVCSFLCLIIYSWVGHHVCWEENEVWWYVREKDFENVLMYQPYEIMMNIFYKRNRGRLGNIFIMSHSLLWRHIVLLTVGVYSGNHRVFYTIGTSMTRRFQKSVGPSVRLSVCNAKKKPTPPSLLIVER